MQAAGEEYVMTPRKLPSALLAIFLATVGTRPATASEDTTAQELKAMWAIGTADHDDVGFALAPGGFREFGTTFPDDVVFVVGQSDPQQHWPYVHPGPDDHWAGSRQHTFTVFFGLKTLPKGDSRLVVELVDTHRIAPPRWRIGINGQVTDVSLPAGAGDDSIYGKPAAGRPHRCEIPVPAAALRVGNNAVAIESLRGSWALYDSIRFEAPADAEATDVKPETTIREGRSAGVILKRRDGALAQPLQLTIQHIGSPAEAVISTTDSAAVPLQLRPGLMNVTIPALAVAQPTPLTVSIQSGGLTLAQRRIDVKPIRPWVVYLLPHSHTDIGYTHVQTEVERRQSEYLELAIDTARKTAEYPEGSRFRWNVEVMWAVDAYLRQASPEQQRAFVDAVQAGWIELDALYGNELTGLCRPEELIRLVQCAGRVARRCGVPLEAAMISDVPGYTWGLVPVLAQAGVKYFSIGPNPSDRIGGTLAEWGDKPFYWQSPSGQERLLCWVAGKGYAFFHGANLGTMGVEPLLAYLSALEESGYPYDLVQVRYSVGGDNGPPDPAMCDFVRDWNETHAAPRLVIATTSEMCRALEQRYADRLPQVRGDFTPYWEDGAASSARETALNRGTAERLVQAETLFTLRGRDKYPEDEFAQAWRNVLLYDEHTWGAWNSISEPDSPFVKQQWEIKQAFALDAHRQAESLLQAALTSAADPVLTKPAIDVLNTCSWPRTGLVTAPAVCASTGDLVKDANGQPVPAQRLSTGELVFLARDVPALGAKRYTVEPGGAAASGKAEAVGLALRTPSLAVRVDEQTGAIASLRSRLPDHEWVDAHAPVAINGYRYMLGSDVAGVKGNGLPTITVQEPGPLVAALRIESDAPGCRKLTREIRLIDGLDAVEILDTVDKQPVRVKEGVHFGFAFDVPAGVMRMDMAWAVIRPEADQLPGACKNWFTVQRWVDISNVDCGVTWVPLDAPLVEVGAMTADRVGSLSNPDEWLRHIAPSQTLYSWAMNNHWHTNYRAEQEGPVTFRYIIQPHAAFDYAAAQRCGLDRSQPLLTRPAAAAPLPDPPFRLEPPDEIVVTSLKPTADGRGWLVRLFNPSDHPVRASLQRAAGPARIQACNLFEEPLAPLSDPIELPAWGLVTLRCD